MMKRLFKKGIEKKFIETYFKYSGSNKKAKQILRDIKNILDNDYMKDCFLHGYILMLRYGITDKYIIANLVLLWELSNGKQEEMYYLLQVFCKQVVSKSLNKIVFYG